MWAYRVCWIAVHDSTGSTALAVVQLKPRKVNPVVETFAAAQVIRPLLVEAETTGGRVNRPGVNVTATSC